VFFQKLCFFKMGRVATTLVLAAGAAQALNLNKESSSTQQQRTTASGSTRSTLLHRHLHRKVSAKIDEAVEAHAVYAEAANFADSVKEAASIVKRHARHRKTHSQDKNAEQDSLGPTATLFKELLGFGEDFTCHDPDSTYDPSIFQIGGITDRKTAWNYQVDGMNLPVFEYSGFDAQLKCRDGSWPVLNTTVMTDDGQEVKWEEACEMGVNQCGGAYDTACYGEKTEKSKAINDFLRKVFIPKFNPCCESHDRGYCYPAGGPDVVSDWTDDKYEYAKGWKPYSDAETSYIYENMLGNDQHPPYNPSGGKLAVDDRFQTCMHRMCADDPVYGDGVTGPVEQIYNSVMGHFSWVPMPGWIKDFAREKIVRNLQVKKNFARGWCDLRAQIAAAAVRAGGLKAYTAKQAAMLSCPPAPNCPDGCLEGSGSEVNSVQGP